MGGETRSMTGSTGVLEKNREKLETLEEKPVL